MECTTEEGWHLTEDGTKLYTKTWKPSAAPKAILVFIHGFSDHCNAYPYFFHRLATQHSIQIQSYDQRGWGRSVTLPSTRGLSGGTTLILSDLTSFIKPLLPPPAPLFLMGHSMGGGIALTYPSFPAAAPILRHIRGILVESPLIALAPTSAASKLTVLLGKLASKMMPNHQLVQKVAPTLMSRDPKVCEEFRDDPLCHNTGTLEGLAAMLDRGERLVSGETMVKRDYGTGTFAVWVGHGSGDQVTDPVASRSWVERCEVVDKEFREYEGWFHKLHAEEGDCKEVFADEVAAWILKRAAPIHVAAAVSPVDPGKAML